MIWIARGWMTFCGLCYGLFLIVTLGSLTHDLRESWGGLAVMGVTFCVILFTIGSLVKIANHKEQKRREFQSYLREVYDKQQTEKALD